MTIANTQDRPHFVYRMFDADDQLLYLGCTADLGARIHAHALYKRWFGDVRRMTFEPHPDRASGLAAEAAGLTAEKPLYDGMGVDLPAGVKRLCVRCRRGEHNACGKDRRMAARWGFTYPCSCENEKGLDARTTP